MSMYIVFCTFPDRESARQTGTDLVAAQLAVCVSLLSGTESIYRWQGAVETSTEVLAIFKTSCATYPAFEKKLRELHTYQVPEIVALRPEQVSADYLRWVMDEALPEGGESK